MMTDGLGAWGEAGPVMGIDPLLIPNRWWWRGRCTETVGNGNPRAASVSFLVQKHLVGGVFRTQTPGLSPPKCLMRGLGTAFWKSAEEIVVLENKHEEVE